MSNGVDPDQTAPIRAVCSRSALFASLLNSSVMLGIICSRRLQQTTFSDTFFLGALRANNFYLEAHTGKFQHKGYGHFLKNFGGPDQNLVAMGYWVPVSLYPC